MLSLSHSQASKGLNWNVLTHEFTTSLQQNTNKLWKGGSKQSLQFESLEILLLKSQVDLKVIMVRCGIMYKTLAELVNLIEVFACLIHKSLTSDSKKQRVLFL